MLCVWMLCQREIVTKGAILALPDGVGGRRLGHHTGGTGTAAVEVGATLQDLRTIVVRDHEVETMTTADDHQRLGREAAVIVTEDSAISTMMASDRRRDHLREANHNRVASGMDNKLHIATARAVLATASTPRTYPKTLHQPLHKLRSHPTIHRHSHSHQCQTNTLDRFLCSLFLHHPHPCRFNHPVDSLEASRRHRHQTTADRFLHRHRTLLQCQTTPTV